MSDIQKNGHHYKLIMFLLGALFSISQAVFIPLMLSANNQLHAHGEMLAGIKPLVDQAALMSTIMLDKSTYEKDERRRSNDQDQLRVEMANVQTRLQEIRLQLAKIELEWHKKLLELKP